MGSFSLSNLNVRGSRPAPATSINPQSPTEAEGFFLPSFSLSIIIYFDELGEILTPNLAQDLEVLMFSTLSYEELYQKTLAVYEWLLSMNFKVENSTLSSVLNEIEYLKNNYQDPSQRSLLEKRDKIFFNSMAEAICYI
jgi:hypothetical protein